VCVMRTVSIITFVALVLFVLGGLMNTSAGLADRKAPVVTPSQPGTQSSGAGVGDAIQQSGTNIEVRATHWLTQFEPLLLLLLGSVLLSVSTGIRLILARK